MKIKLICLATFFVNLLVINANTPKNMVLKQNPNLSILSMDNGENDDGYIYKGRISLRQVITGRYDTFEYYVKEGRGYVKYRRWYYPLSGNRVTINYVQYYTT